MSEVRKMVKHTRIEAWIEEFLWAKHSSGVRFVTTAEIHDVHHRYYPGYGLTMPQLTNVLSKRIRFGSGPMARTATVRGRYEECRTWFSLTWRPSE